MIGALPTEFFWPCTWCKKNKAWEDYPVNETKLFGIDRSYCLDCKQKSYASRREATDRVRLRQRLQESTYIAIDRMCREDPEFLMKVVNINPRLFRYHREKAAYEIMKKIEKSKLAYLVRGKSISEVKRKQRVEKKPQWISVTDALTNKTAS